LLTSAIVTVVRRTLFAYSLVRRSTTSSGERLGSIQQCIRMIDVYFVMTLQLIAGVALSPLESRTHYISKGTFGHGLSQTVAHDVKCVQASIMLLLQSTMHMCDVHTV
jgi:hypothetical protein